MTISEDLPVGTAAPPTSRWRPRWWHLLLTAVLVIPPFVSSAIELNRLSRLVVLAIAVLGVNLLTGYTGLISLGHGVFVGVGAFAVANMIETGIPLLFAGILATLLSGAVGLVLGLPALRVRGLHLALITFGFALAFGPIARRLPRWTGGPTGITVNNDGFAPPGFLGIDDHTHIWRYGLSLIVVAIWFVIARNLINSRMGRALRAVRDNEAAAASFGIDIPRAKAGALAVSAAMAGTAGVLQALINPFVGQGEFDAFLSLRLYAAAVMGGLGTIVGAVYGVLALITVPTLNGFVGLIDNDEVVFGLGLVLITLMAPNGIAGALRDLRARRKA